MAIDHGIYIDSTELSPASSWIIGRRGVWRLAALFMGKGRRGVWRLAALLMGNRAARGLAAEAAMGERWAALAAGLTLTLTLTLLMGNRAALATLLMGNTAARGLAAAAAMVERWAVKAARSRRGRPLIRF